ncbi:MAG: YfhO family protein, partial [Planctomycetota bacterium]|nr:YfhO family protein [Planctomycetota bacterium]
HLQTSLHLTLVLAAWCLFRTRVVIGGARLGGAGWGRLLTGGVLGLLLAAPQILPFLEYVGHESQGAIVLETEEQTAELDLLDAAAVMVAPGIHGGPHTNDYTGPEGRNINFNEIIGGYVGRLMLVLALVGAARSIGRGRDSRALFLACLALVAALVAWQVWPLHDIVRAIPGLRSTNTTRLLLFVAFGLAALGAIGVDALRERLRLEGRKAAVLGLACFAVTAGELVAFGDGYNPAIEPHLAYPRTPVTDFLAGEEGLYRVEGVHRTTLRASANLPYGISKLSGYDKIEFRPMTQLALLLTTGAVEGPFHSEIDVIDRMEALPLASLLGIRFLISEEELPPPLELAYTSPGGLFVYSNPGVLPRAFVARGFVVLEDQDERLAHLGAADMDPSIAVLHRRPEGEVDVDATGFAGTVEVERYAPLEVVLRAEMERPGLVVLADAFHPGWTATVDGGEVEIERVDHALRGIWLGAGESRIEMRYEPASMRMGLALGAFALLAIGALIGLGRRSR